jgi:hypothetical protein
MVLDLRLPGLALALWLLSGCSPFGSSSEPKDLFPADSVSRQIAEAIAPETLELLIRIEPDTATFFGSMQIGPDSLIWIGDLSDRSIRRFTLGGEEMTAIRSPEIQYPYLAGRSGSTSFIFDVGTESLLRVESAHFVDRIALPARAGGLSLSRFVSVVGEHMYVKDTGSRDNATLAVSSLGGPPVRVKLPGQPWRYHGVLKTWGQRMVGVSSFRPILYFFDSFARLDSMSLVGFDSPMLARSRAFALGEVSDPPLLISSFSAVANRLFVLNVRPGILRIDEYDETGRLMRAFQREAPVPESYTPVDLIALPDSSRGLLFFVISTSAQYGSLSLDYRSRLDKLAPVEIGGTPESP